nr:SusC/RagA family TonB-linked outer membrane protein [uncultured Carboxylicivirga sp.]
MKKTIVRATMRRFRSGLKPLFVFGLCLVAFTQFVSAEGSITGNYNALQQDGKTVTGRVLDSNGEPLIGVSIVIEGTTQGVITDLDGNYSIVVPSEESVLLFSFIGFNAERVAVAGQSSINITLIEDVTELEGVVVTALGIKREKKALTYSQQTVSTDELSEARSLNVANSLSGKVAGLNFSTTGGGVGSSSRVTLRGNRSLTGNNQPLYVIDGVPMDNNVASTASADIGGRTSSDGISNINPEDIESMSVLKGASAAALYGTRASNGVIIITTKKGAKGQDAKITISSNLMFSKAYNMLNLQDTYGQGSKGLYDPTSRLSWGPEMNGQQVDAWQLSFNPDYAGPATYSMTPQPDNGMDFFETGYNWAKSVSASMGNEKIQGYFSYTNTTAQGIVKGNELSRHNLNVRLTSDLTDKLHLDAKTNFISQTIDNPLNTGESSVGEAVYTMPRSMQYSQYKDYDYIDAAGLLQYNYPNPNSIGGLGGNPYWYALRQPYTEERDRFIGFASAKYDFTEDLSLMIRSGIDQSTNKNVSSQYASMSVLGNDVGSYSETTGQTMELNSDFLLSYNKDLGDFRFGINLGGNSLYQRRYSLNVGGQLSRRNFFAISNLDTTTPTSSFYEKRINSMYAFGQLGYKEYLYLDVTARNDWSSTLPADNRSYFYPSVGLTAVLSDMLNIESNFLTFLKARGSYAQVGNDTDPYRLSNELLYYGFNGGVVQSSTTNNNSELKPEISTSKEVGVDARFFGNKIGLDFTYFQTNTKDQIFTINVPEVSGYANEVVNGGEIKNNGFEITFNADVLHRADFTWDLSANFAKYQTKVLSIMEGRDELAITTGYERVAQTIVKEGGEYGDLYIRGYARDDAGNIIVNAATGLPEFTSGFDVLAGNYNPDFTAGLTNRFNYKNFSLSFLIDFRVGGEVISYTQARMAGAGVSDITLNGRTNGFVVDGVNVAADGTTTRNTTSVLAEDYWTQVASRDPRSAEDFVFDATNIRLRELVLGYSLPKSILGNGPFAGVSVSAVGRNLFFFVNKAEYFDPEQGVGVGNLQGIESFNIPSTRDFGFNVKLDF